MTAMSDAVADQHEDVLGPDYTAQTLPLRPDAEGPLVATLVRRNPQQQSRRAVLYLHGFADYFFHTHVADAFVEQGYDFYALDLRRYGRSLLPGQTPYYSTDIAEYDEEIDAAIDLIRAEGHDEVVAYGHSTGGLIFPLWANRRRGLGLIQAMVLNSPFFDLNGTDFERGFLTQVVDKVGRFAPRIIVSTLQSPYARALHTSNGGEWDFDPEWKKLVAFPVRAGSARSIRRAHARIARGLDLEMPILVAASTASGVGKENSPQLKDTDCVLNVEHMVTGAARIGKDVTVVRIKSGLHDLTLSPPPVRQKFLEEMFGWLGATLPVR
jgi:alpha-beta hydrolase superfamily lysophospholipase